MGLFAAAAVVPVREFLRQPDEFDEPVVAVGERVDADEDADRDDGPAPDEDDAGWEDVEDDADADRWAITPAELTMAERVDLEAERFRGWKTDLGDLLADQLEATAAAMRLTGAGDPATFLDRHAAMLAGV